MASIEWLLLADEAHVRERASEEDIYHVDIVRAGWTLLTVQALPAIVPTVGVAFAIRHTYPAIGIDRELDLDIVDPQERSISRRRAGFAAGPFATAHTTPDPDRLDIVAPYGITLRDVRFTQAGWHSVVIRANGAEIGRLRFLVRLRPVTQDRAPNGE